MNMELKEFVKVFLKTGNLLLKKANRQLNEPKEEITGNVFSGKGLLKNLYSENAFIQYEGEFKNKKLNGKGKC